MIYYRGMNCWLACVVSIADALGLDYLDAFCDLWSETEFKDEAEYNIFVSRRIFDNLDEMGVAIEKLDCDDAGVARSFESVGAGEYLLVGMDLFHIPWHPVRGTVHDGHYFYARKESTEAVACYDPIYDIRDFLEDASALFRSTFEFSRVFLREKRKSRNRLRSELEDVLRNHPGAAENIAAAMIECESGGGDLNVLIKRIGAMINNRCLFARFWERKGSRDGKLFFNKEFFIRWEGVRNGLYKAAILRDKAAALEETRGLFLKLMRDETEAARRFSRAI